MHRRGAQRARHRLHQPLSRADTAVERRRFALLYDVVLRAIGPTRATRLAAPRLCDACPRAAQRRSARAARLPRPPDLRVAPPVRRQMQGPMRSSVACALLLLAGRAAALELVVPTCVAPRPSAASPAPASDARSRFSPCAPMLRRSDKAPDGSVKARCLVEELQPGGLAVLTWEAVEGVVAVQARAPAPQRSNCEAPPAPRRKPPPRLEPRAPWRLHHTAASRGRAASGAPGQRWAH